MINLETQAITAGDGQTITATFFLPAGECQAAVLIVPAMGVCQKFYAPLASWLAARGYLVATFDFSGIGLSRHGNLSKLKVNVIDWARFECAAMIDAVAARSPDKPLYWLGHSLGGQILGFVPNREHLTKAVTIACGSGYWLENSPGLRWKVWWLWYAIVPFTMRLFGYYPGKRLRMIGDLPSGVMSQWRSWCLNPEYAVGVEGAEVRAQFAAVHIPITSLSFTDDEFMSARNTESIHSFYTNSPKSMKRIAPQDIGVERIGHFGFFNARFEPTLWREHLLPELD
jgi:predicted alpha/beta hydrolase